MPKISTQTDISAEQMVFHASVGEIIAHVLRHGDLDTWSFSSNSTKDPIKIHQSIQKKRGPDYQAEVPIVGAYQADNSILHISGRIDGMMVNEDKTIIEEIKTTYQDLEDLSQQANISHWGQLKLYAWMVATERGLATLHLQLTYFHMPTSKIETLLEEWSYQALDLFAKELVANYLAWLKMVAAWKQKRNQSIDGLAFPFPNMRAGQNEMIKGIEQAISKNGYLIVQAATGIGKTSAALYPSLKHLAAGKIEKLFYLTAKTTGKISAQTSLEQMRQKGLRLKSLTLTAKKKICFNPDKECTPKECAFAKGHFDRDKPALEQGFRESCLDTDYISALAANYKICPYELSLDLALWADVIICDYNYVFDPRVYLRRFFEETIEKYTFLVDEAQNLPDRAREMYSTQIEKAQVLQLRRKAKSHSTGIYQALGKVNGALLKIIKQSEDKGRLWYDPVPSKDILEPLKKCILTIRAWLTDSPASTFRKEILEFILDAVVFVDRLEAFDDHYVACYEHKKNELRYKLFCVDPKQHMAQVLNHCQSAVFFSATLTPMEYFTRLFGIEHNTASMVLPTPFPEENLFVGLLSRTSTYYRHREQTKFQLAKLLQHTFQARPGKYLIFFPSYAYLSMVVESLRQLDPQLPVIVQTPGLTEKKRSDFLSHFEHNDEKPVAGFAVLGGVFAEGIDLIGERLSGVVIIGTGHAPITIERTAIQNYFTEINDQGFEFAYLYPGMNKVLQAAGRVIRSESDKGAVLLIDQRYGRPQYHELLPDEWKVRSLAGEEELAKALAEFWSKP